MNRPRILQIGKFYPPFMGGIEMYLQRLCRELQKAVDVTVLVANQGRESLEEIIDGVTVKRIGRLFDFWGAPICPGFAQQIKALPADLTHIHLPNPGAVLAYLGSGCKGPLVVTYHSDIVRQKFLTPFFQPLLRRFLDQCSAIIAASPNSLESSPLLSCARPRCRVIPYGISVEEFQVWDREKEEKIRKAYGPRIVLSVGRLVYYKGLGYLIRSMQKVRAKLLIVGEGPLWKNLTQEAKRQAVNDRVIFLGRVKDVIPYYHAADVLVLPSIAHSEAFGIVQLEAMACRKPVVNTRIPSGVPFVSIDGATGITVPPRDPEALAKAINLLLDNPELRKKYGEAGYERVCREFPLERMVNQTLQLYREVLGKEFVPLEKTL